MPLEVEVEGGDGRRKLDGCWGRRRRWKRQTGKKERERDLGSRRRGLGRRLSGEGEGEGEKRRRKGCRIHTQSRNGSWFLVYSSTFCCF